jgi:hypothetical protein
MIGALIFSLSAASCIPVPYPVTPEVAISEKPVLANDILLSVGPRELLESISREIKASHENIEIIDGELFRDTAFPEGGWRLGQLLEPSTCNRVQQQLNIDYLVIVGPEKLILSDDKFFYIPFLIGAGSEDKVSRISSVILDMKTGEMVCQISSEAHGTERAAIYIVIVAGTIALTSSSAIKGLAREVGRVINNLSKSEKIRIAVIAAESELHK